MSAGRNEEVSACCSARLESKGDICNGFWKTCSECGKGRWPHGVRTKWVYRPSDYEKTLEARIAELERRLERLEPKEPAEDPFVGVPVGLV